MIRPKNGSTGFRAGLAAALLCACAASPAASLTIANGDVVLTFSKNGFEQVVNVGPFPVGSPVVLNLGSELTIPEFGGTVDGAVLVALAVTDPQQTVDFGLGVVPQENVVFSTHVNGPSPSDANIAGAMASVDQGATAWFALLRGLGGGSDELIESVEAYSYSNKLGLGSDAIANNFLFSTAGTISGTLQIHVYEGIRGYEGFPGGPPTQINHLGTISVDAGTSVVTLPEPGSVTMLAVGSLAVLVLGRRRIRA